MQQDQESSTQVGLLLPTVANPKNNSSTVDGTVSGSNQLAKHHHQNKSNQQQQHLPLPSLLSASSPTHQHQKHSSSKTSNNSNEKKYQKHPSLNDDDQLLLEEEPALVSHRKQHPPPSSRRDGSILNNNNNVQIEGSSITRVISRDNTFNASTNNNRQHPDEEKASFYAHQENRKKLKPGRPSFAGSVYTDYGDDEEEQKQPAGVIDVDDLDHHKKSSKSNNNYSDKKMKRTKSTRSLNGTLKREGSRATNTVALALELEKQTGNVGGNQNSLMDLGVIPLEFGSGQRSGDGESAGGASPANSVPKMGSVAQARSAPSTNNNITTHAARSNTIPSNSNIISNNLKRRSSSKKRFLGSVADPPPQNLSDHDQQQQTSSSPKNVNLARVSNNTSDVNENASPSHQKENPATSNTNTTTNHATSQGLSVAFTTTNTTSSGISKEQAKIKRQELENAEVLSPDDVNNDNTAFAGGVETSDASSSHGRSSQGDSSHASDKLGQVYRMLDLVPGKDRDELLMRDVDEQQQEEDDDVFNTQETNACTATTNEDLSIIHGNKKRNSSPPHFSPLSGNQNNKKKDTRSYDPNNLEQLCDALEECASENEKGKRFFEETLDNPFTAVVVINAQTQTILWVNRFATFMFNLVESDLVGQDVSMLMGQVPGRDNKSFHHKKISNFLATWAQKGVMPDSKIASGRVQELVCTRFEGIKKVPFSAHMVVRPVRMTMRSESVPPIAFVGYFRDYTTEKALKSNLAQQRFTAQECSEAIVTMDLKGTIRGINKAACKLFGYSEKFIVKSEANIKLLMPDAVARNHDRYLKTFRDKLKTPGFDMKTSPIIAKERDLVARRADGVEFPIMLRVELQMDLTHSGNDRLVGYVRDRRALIKSSDFNLEVSKRLFPESIANMVSQKTDISLVETYKNIPVVLIDIVDFQKYVKGMDNESIADLLSTFFKQIAELAAGFQVEVVKSNADGMICVNGIDEFDERKSRMDRAVAFALSLLRWTQENDRRVRIGIGYGELGSAVFEISKGRPTWDVWASAINESSRMEKNAEPQTLQITQSAFKALSEHDLQRLFREKKYDEGIKGMQDTGATLVTYQTSLHMDHQSTLEVTDKIKNASMSRVYLKKENARQLKEQQERRTLTSA